MEDKKIDLKHQDSTMILEHIKNLSKEDLLKLFNTFFNSYGLENGTILSDKNDTINNTKMEQIANLSVNDILTSLLENDSMIPKDTIDDSTRNALKEQMFSKGIIIIPSEKNITILDLNSNDENLKKIQFNNHMYTVTEGQHLFSYKAYYSGIFVPPQNNSIDADLMYSVVFNDSKNEKFNLNDNLIAYQELLHQIQYKNDQLSDGKVTVFENKNIKDYEGQPIGKYEIDKNMNMYIKVNREEVLGDFLTMKMSKNSANPMDEYKWISFLTDTNHTQGTYSLSYAIVNKGLDSSISKKESFEELKKSIVDSNYKYEFTKEDITLMHGISDTIDKSYKEYFKTMNNKDLNTMIKFIDNEFSSSLETDKKVILSDAYVTEEFSDKIKEAVSSYNDLTH